MEIHEILQYSFRRVTVASLYARAFSRRGREFEPTKQWLTANTLPRDAVSLTLTFQSTQGISTLRLSPIFEFSRQDRLANSCMKGEGDLLGSKSPSITGRGLTRTI